VFLYNAEISRDQEARLMTVHIQLCGTERNGTSAHARIVTALRVSASVTSHLLCDLCPSTHCSIIF